MRRTFLVSSTIAALAFAPGCGARVRTVPAPAGPPAPAAVEEYRIQPGDQLDVKFFYNAELNEQVTVRPDGRISLQLVRDVGAAGRTPNDLTDQLEVLYGPHLQRPKIAVIVRTFTEHRVFLDGEVQRPGTIALAGRMTVSQAIAVAGGPRETADTGSVLLIRRAADGSRTVFTVDVDEAREGRGGAQDLAVQAQDIVYVPKSAIANVNQWVDQYLRKNIPIPVYVPFEPLPVKP